MLSDELNVSIRWRWLLTGMAVIIASAACVWLIHELQVSAMAQRVLDDARRAAQSGEVATARQRYETCVSLDPRNAVAYEEFAGVVLEGERSHVNDITAMNLLDAALQFGSKKRETRLQFFKVATRLGRYAAALRTIDDALLEQDPDAELLAMRALCHLRKGNNRKAQQDLDAAMQLEPDNTEAWKTLIELTQATEGAEAALAVAERMAEVVPGAESRIIKARYLQQTQHLKAAGDAWWAAAKLDPQNPETARNFADHIMNHVPPDQNMDLEMVATAYEILTSNSDTSDYLTSARLADLAHRLNRVDEAEKHYRRCLQHHPQDWFALGRIAELQIQSGRFQAAHATLDEMADSRSVALLSRMLRGRLLLEEGRLPEACDTLKAAIRETGDSKLLQGAHYFLVQALWQSGREAEAVQVAGDLQSVASGSDDARELMLQSLMKNRQLEEAVQQLQEFRQPEDYVSPLINELIEFAASNGQLTQLEHHVESIRILRPSSSVPQLFRIWMLNRQGQVSQAVHVLMTLEARFPNSPEYQDAEHRIETEVRSRLSKNSATLSFSPSDDYERMVKLLLHLEQSDLTSAVQAISALLSPQSSESDSLLRGVTVLEQAVVRFCVTQSRRTVAQQFLNQLNPLLQTLVRSGDPAIIRRVAACMTASGQDDHSRSILVEAIRSNLHPALVVDLFRSLAHADAATIAQVRQVLGNSFGADAPEKRAVIQAEFLKLEGNSEGAQQQLEAVFNESQTNLAVTCSLLRNDADNSGARRRSRPVIDRLLQHHRNDSDVMFACGCSLRSSLMLTESLQCFLEADQLRPDPVILLHAAETRRQMDRHAEAAQTLKLALARGLSPGRLNLQDRRLLDRMLASPEFRDLRPANPLAVAESRPTPIVE
ncbi:MAG: tetratricopeptide repeat protein [Planctomycetaceae bacterium]